MRRLILLRHAKALRNRPGGQDIDRPLSEEGRADAQLIGQVLAAEGLVPDRALVSAARRTQETWASASPAFPGAQARISKGLYLADAPTLLAAVNAEEDADTLMVVAHNPGVQALAHALLLRSSAPLSILAKFDNGFPTATAAVFAIDAAGRAAYDGLFLVAYHGGGGGE